MASIVRWGTCVPPGPSSYTTGRPSCCRARAGNSGRISSGSRVGIVAPGRRASTTTVAGPGRWPSAQGPAAPPRSSDRRTRPVMQRHPAYTRDRVAQLAARVEALVHADTVPAERLLLAGPVDRISHDEALELDYRL